MNLALFMNEMRGEKSLEPGVFMWMKKFIRE